MGVKVSESAVSYQFITDEPHPYNKIGDGPEGPEVRTVADKLRPYLVGQAISLCVIGRRAVISGVEHLTCSTRKEEKIVTTGVEEQWETKVVTGSPVEVLSVRSYGKKIIFDLKSGHMIIVSLGMVGRVCFQPGNHTHIDFTISNTQGAELYHIYYDDYRYMGGIVIIPNEAVPRYFSDLGPCLLTCALDEKTWIPKDTWKALFTQKKWRNRQICVVLLEQSVVAAIGNYLVSETLYYAGILPSRIVSSLTDEEWENLRVAAHKIIVISYSYGGLTIKDFISPDGQKGTYPRAVYDRTTDPMGNQIVKGKMKTGRNCYWVPAIQR